MCDICFRSFSVCVCVCVLCCCFAHSFRLMKPHPSRHQEVVEVVEVVGVGVVDGEEGEGEDGRTLEGVEEAMGAINTTMVAIREGEGEGEGTAIEVGTTTILPSRSTTSERECIVLRTVCFMSLLFSSATTKAIIR